MGVYSSKSICIPNNMLNYSLNNKCASPKLKPDNDYQADKVAAHYLMKHIINPTTPDNIRAILLNDIIKRNPKLMETLALPTVTNPNLTDSQKAYKARIKKINTQRNEIIASLQTTVGQAITLHTTTQQQIAKLKATRQQMADRSQQASSSVSAYPSPVSPDDEAAIKTSKALLIISKHA